MCSIRFSVEWPLLLTKIDCTQLIQALSAKPTRSAFQAVLNYMASHNVGADEVTYISLLKVIDIFTLNS